MQLSDNPKTNYLATGRKRLFRRVGNWRVGIMLMAYLVPTVFAMAADPVPPKILPFKTSKTINVRQAGAKGDGQADDATAIQKALDGGDCKVVFPPGTYKIGKTLKVASKTWLKADEKTVFYFADGAGKDADSYMLTNVDPVNGNQDIIIEGGTWDGNNPNNPRGPRHGPRPAYGGVAICFANVQNLTIRDLTVRNPETFSILLGETEDFLVENIVFDQSSPQHNQDGVHVNGYSQRGLIRNLSVSSPTGTNDDMVALNANDDINAMFCHGMKEGPIKDVRIENLSSKNAYTFVRLLSAGQPVENVVVDGVSGGFRMNGINIDSWRFPPGTGILRNITLRNFRIHKTDDNPHPFIRLHSKVDGLKIENFQREPGGSSAAPTMLIDNQKTNQIETSNRTVLDKGSINALKLDTK